MITIRKEQLLIYIAAVLAISGLGLWYLHQRRVNATHNESPVALQRGSDKEGGALLTVHVVGAVKRPGVYKVKAGAIVLEAVREAGGATRKADLAGINLAAKLDDGRQVVVPAKVDADSSGRPGSATQDDAPINLNTATPEQLDKLEGVGPATIDKIIEYRKEHGGLSSVEDLDSIPGIGQKKIENFKKQLNL